MALLTITITLLALPLALFAWTANSLYKNVAKARAMGLPYLIRWISPVNPFWLLYGSSIIRLCQLFNIATDDMNRIYSFGWEANERSKIFEDHGDVYLLVHPGGVEVKIADAELIYDVLRRRKDFRRNMEEMAVLNVYGKNLSTVDDEEWQRHRKMTGVTFTEKNNELVWQHSIVQAKGMLEYWTKRAVTPVRTTHNDTKILTLNVLAAVLFNRVYSFEGFEEEKKNDHANDSSYEYRKSLAMILRFVIEIFIFGEKGLKAWWTPKSWKRAAGAMATFRSYIYSLLEEERGRITKGETDNNHLVARLARAGNSRSSGKEGGQESNDRMTLTEQEILSNLFVYAFAGNDTTSVALLSIIIHLAACPGAQEWISEEINHYLKEEDPQSWDYSSFSKLKRCSAVIMETLRITHPLALLVKTTGPTSQPLTIKGTVYNIPADTSVHLSIAGMHTLPRYWGANPMEYNPGRFINNSDAHGSIETETLASDTQDHFLPWAWGQRVCPGKRFSQVELVAVLAVLFRSWRVEPVPEGNETASQARVRAWKSSLVVDHQGHMLHEIFQPERVGLQWTKQ